ncbi:hypothetical protein Patl1_22497 [Pistacia atlantica]|uniref:Uncharacterized protein n=1 Tax=Pistacia atlantica TaxID=434234 RepID=A0ACC0ZU91_9ROSI|nr:hypothetical protein Patl1_22497 [Pistacia atlantica]
MTLIPGDGIRPLVTEAVEQVMDVMHAPVYFEKLRTPMGGGVSSLNVKLRKELDLYASLVNCYNLPGLPTHHQNVDIVVIRENTEGGALADHDLESLYSESEEQTPAMVFAMDLLIVPTMDDNSSDDLLQW